MLFRRTCNAPAPGGVVLQPNNPPNGYLAWSYADLLAMQAVRTVLQFLWGGSFPATNTARERGAFFFQHRTDPARPVRVVIGGNDRSEEFDQRVIGPTPAGWYFGDPGQEIGDFTALGPDGNQDYVLIATAHTHPFLNNQGRGLRVQPSSADHRVAWQYGIPMLVVTRRGTYVAGPERRITRANANDPTLTNLVAEGNPEIEMGYDMVPQNQIPPYDPNAYNPVAGNIAFTPQHVQDQLDEPTGSQPNLPDGHGGGQNTGQENTRA